MSNSFIRLIIGTLFFDLFPFFYWKMLLRSKHDKIYKPGIGSTIILLVMYVALSDAFGFINHSHVLLKILEFAIYAIVSLPLIWGVEELVLRDASPKMIGEAYNDGRLDAKEEDKKYYGEKISFLENEIQILQKQINGKAKGSSD